VISKFRYIQNLSRCLKFIQTNIYVHYLCSRLITLFRTPCILIIFPLFRYSHCAVGLGNGSVIVTGGYGGLDVAERLDIESGLWHPLPELSPVRAQHGCALVTLHGEEGVLVVGGDSGGTRLKG
jgi:hypothetical protein